MKDERPSKLSWLMAFKEAYEKYKKNNRAQDLPDYSELIGEYFFGLSSDISNLPLAPDVHGSTWDLLAKDNYKIRKYLSTSKVGKITFHGSAGPFDIESQPIIHEIIHNLFYNIASYPLQKPQGGVPPKNLARLLITSKDLILELKREGISNELLVEFIPKAVAFAPPSALAVSPAFDLEGNSVVPIASVEAFQKALDRA